MKNKFFLTTGKVQYAVPKNAPEGSTDKYWNNCISFVVPEGKTATVTVYAALKSDKTDISLTVLDDNASAVTVSYLTKDGVSIDSFDALSPSANSVTKYVFTLTAGSYHLGGTSGGAYVYDVLVSLA